MACVFALAVSGRLQLRYPLSYVPMTMRVLGAAALSWLRAVPRLARSCAQLFDAAVMALVYWVTSDLRKVVQSSTGVVPQAAALAGVTNETSNPVCTVISTASRIDASSSC